MNLEHTDSFSVFPADCNYHYPMIFGGKMMAEMDRTAATAARRFLYDSPTGAKYALTVNVNIDFSAGAEVGDLIFITAKIKEVGLKRIVVHVRAEKESNDPKKTPITAGDPTDPRNIISYKHAPNVTRKLMAEGTIAFCAYNMEIKKSMEHGLWLTP